MEIKLQKKIIQFQKELKIQIQLFEMNDQVLNFFDYIYQFLKE